MIEGFIRKARIGYAAVPAEQALDWDKKMQALQEENERLKNSLRQVRANLAERIAARPPLPPALSEPETAARVAPPGGAAKPENARYQVRRGDTLSALAARFYHDPRKWKPIYDANQDVLRGTQQLRVGQVLVIPP
ncbi:MAG: LysM peptidoglycan-binding domain-containing protein [Lentisphaerae bacterium]|nr:LysM peptidoglycan-binding domain-containing protein [Lentisphaerota bacterium]